MLGQPIRLLAIIVVEAGVATGELLQNKKEHNVLCWLPTCAAGVLML